MTGRRRTSAAERESREHARREKLEKLHDQLTQGVEALATSGEWQRWLSVASRFPRYSMWNSIAIMMQCENATAVCGYKSWQALGRQVRKGENGITILAPVKRRVTIEAETDAQTDDTAEPTTVRRLSGFTTATVFDISQTDGEPIPERPGPKLLTGPGPAGLWEALAAQITAAGYVLELVDPASLGGANGRTWAPPTARVEVRNDVEPLQAVKTQAHERAHIALGHLDGICGDQRSRREIEAESVAYLVLGAADVDTTSYSFPYVADWAGGDVEAVKQTAVRVVEVAHQIIAELPLADESETEVAEAS